MSPTQHIWICLLGRCKELLRTHHEWCSYLSQNTSCCRASQLMAPAVLVHIQTTKSFSWDGWECGCNAEAGP